MQVCAEPAVIVGGTVVLWLGPVESLQALDYPDREQLVR